MRRPDEFDSSVATFKLSKIKAFMGARQAVTSIEYAMIAGVITLAIVGSLATTVGPTLSRTFNTISSEL